MKGKLLTLILILAFVSNAIASNGFTTWLLGDYNQQGVRVGHELGDRAQFEIGLQSYWWPDETIDPPQTYGIYGIYDFPGVIDVNAIPVLAPFADQISLASYIGFQGAIELRGDYEERGYYGPLLGMVLTKFLFDEVDDAIFTGTEIQYVNYVDQWEEDIVNDELRVTFFLRIKY